MATEAACFGTDINTKGLNSSLFSMPRDLSLVDPLCSGCTPIAGAFDPASILVRASVLVATSSALPTPSTRAMPASSLAHQLASETVANAQPEASSKQQQPPNDGSVDTVLAPAATGASGRAQNPQDPVPSHPGKLNMAIRRKAQAETRPEVFKKDLRQAIPLKTKSRIQREIHRKVQGTTQATQIQINKILIRLRSLHQRRMPRIRRTAEE